MASLDERLGLLLVLRIGLVVLVVLGSFLLDRNSRLELADIGPLSAAYLFVVGGAEWYRRS
jgi:hypothetical protein